MNLRSGDVMARALVCAILLASALGLSVTRLPVGRGGDEAAPAPGGERPPSGVRFSNRLDASVHPAADALYGALWAQSHRLIMPVAGIEPARLVDTFEQVRGMDRRHEAIDIPAAAGTAVVAVTDGVILRLAQHDSGGITLYQLAPDGHTLFYYAHLARYAEGVRAGLVVRQGDVIGYVGDTGNAGPGNYHLHFEVMTAPSPQHYWAGRPSNPYPLLKRARG
jgi:murein DD-endopeptidase MepM/ murein hydrolase activator NlpD